MFAINEIEVVRVKDIDKIMGMLSWRNSEKTQQKGIEFAKKIKHLDVFIMPYDFENKMDAWENCAKVLASKSDDVLAPYAFKLIEWIYDLMIPGAEIIFERLKSFSEAKENLVTAITLCTENAVTQRDERWLASIAGLLDNEKIKTTLPEKVLLTLQKQCR